jgi:WhiB family transcriptional regulator, redox-sensing transcriptional regulator
MKKMFGNPSVWWTTHAKSVKFLRFVSDLSDSGLTRTELHPCNTPGKRVHRAHSLCGGHATRVEEESRVSDRGTIAELALLPLADAEELAWQERALCAQTDPEAFFPEKGGSTREAKRVCLSCDVRDECLEYALANDERFGIWGGLSERERRRLKKRAV